MKCHDCQTKTKVEETRVSSLRIRRAVEMEHTQALQSQKNCDCTLWSLEMAAEVSWPDENTSRVCVKPFIDAEGMRES
jgi:hypothetical protein